MPYDEQDDASATPSSCHSTPSMPNHTLTNVEHGRDDQREDRVARVRDEDEPVLVRAADDALA